MSRYTSHRLGTARIDAMARNIVNGMLSNRYITDKYANEQLMEKAAVMAFKLIDEIDALVIRKLAAEMNTPPITKAHQCSRFIGDGSDGGCENWEKCGPELKETLEKIKKTVQESELYKDFQDSGSRRMPISVIDAIETLLNPSKGKLITESKATWVNGRALAPHDEY